MRKLKEYMDIIPFDKYRDKNGREYQVLLTALSLDTEKEEVVVQQLQGSNIRFTIPRDKFDRIFTRIADEKMDRAPVAALEREMGRGSRPAGRVTAPAPRTEDLDHEAWGDAARDMLAFLDSDDFDEKYMIVEHMAQNDELDDTRIDNMAASIDVVINDGPLDMRTRELLKCLGTRKRYENTRIRGNQG